MVYHRVTGKLSRDVDLPFSIFRRQMKFLHRTGRVIPYEDALKILQSQENLSYDLFVLTFDDGYEDFYTHAFSLLQDFQIPATLFVTTGFVEEGFPYVFSAPLSQKIPSVSWDMLGEMQESGLVTLGAHTHTHLELPGQSEERIIEELKRPLQLFKKRLGISVKHFAYPKGCWDIKTESLVKKVYTSAVTGGGSKITVKSFHPYRIPRIPIRRSDGWIIFLAKVRGWLEREVFVKKYQESPG